MSYDAYPGYVWNITEDKIVKLQLDSFMLLREFMIQHDLIIDDLANDFNGRQFEGMFLDLEREEYDTLQKLYDTFCADFKNKTGLNIWLSSVCDGEGDIEEGGFWTIDATMIRPEAEALGITWEDQKLFVVYG